MTKSSVLIDVPRQWLLSAYLAARHPAVRTMVREMEREESLSREEIEARQFASVKGLVQVAVSRSEAYRRLYAEHGWHAGALRSIEDLAALPVLNRRTLGGFDTGRLLTGSGRLSVVRQTTGTTGRPFTMFVDRNGHDSQLAARRHCFARCGVALGEPEARFWGRPSETAGGWWRNRALGRRVFQFADADVGMVRRSARALLRLSPAYLYGYASLLVRAADVWEAEGFERPASLKAIVSTAETLQPYQRKRLEAVFACPVYEEYGCSEIDIIAFTCRERRLHIVSHNVIVESMASAEGRELVVTALQNRLMPLIRYRLGDCGEVSWESCPCGRTTPQVVKLRGRSENQTARLSDGTIVHAVEFDYVLDELCEGGIPVRQCRVVQTAPDSFDILIDLGESAAPPGLDLTVKEAVGRRLKPGVGIRLVFGPIPHDPIAKFSAFVPLSTEP